MKRILFSIIGVCFISQVVLGVVPVIYTTNYAATTSVSNTLSVLFPFYNTNSGTLTTSYLNVIQSTPVSVAQMYACDTSGFIMKVAVGTTLSAQDLFSIQNGCNFFPVNSNILPVGSQIVIGVASGSTISSPQGKSLSVPTQGYNVIDLLQ